MRIPPGRQQMVLGALLFGAGHPVSSEQLIDVVWGEDPPDTARTQIQICISRLRRGLADGGLGSRILTAAPGYLLELGAEPLDLNAFDGLVSEADALVGRGERERAAALLRSASALWRGPTLDGTASEVLRAKAARLDERRLDTVETYIDLELALGRDGELVGELRGLVHDHPLRERIRAQLMLALYRSGRQAEALDVYRAGRELLVEEMGLEPGEELRSLEAAILAGERVEAAPRVPGAGGRGRGRRGEPDDGPAATAGPAADSAPAPAAPASASAARARQLPPDTGDFVGRDAELRAVERTLTGADGRRGARVAVVVGRPGVGKSALAAHVAHRLVEGRFPDDHLYCDLHGSQGEPIPPEETLGRFLRALGIPGPALPAGLDERAEMYRSLLADRRALIVLDDAAGEAQIAPLLPGSGDSAVLVTSRTRLTGIPGARPVELDVLSTDRSLDLLALVLGEERVTAAGTDAVALVQAVGQLPLALRIVAARLAARPHWSLASMVARLSDERRVLDELEHGQMMMRASLVMSYDGMDARSRRVLRMLGAAGGATIPGWQVGALLGEAVRDPSDLLEPLFDVQLLDVVGYEAADHPVFRLHNMVRAFARERLAAEEDPRQCADALRREVGGWMALAEQAHDGIYGGPHLALHGTGPRWRPPGTTAARVRSEPLEWLDTWHQELCSAVARAADAGLDELCWDLALGLVPLFERRGYLDEWERTNAVATAAVRCAGNRRGAAALTFSEGILQLTRRRRGAAFARLTEAEEAFTELGDVLGRAMCRRELAFLELLRGGAGARRQCEQALADFRALGDPVGIGRALLLKSRILTEEGRHTEGMRPLDEALALYRDAGYTRGRAQVLRRLGQVFQARGEARRAEEKFLESYELVRRLGDVIGEGFLAQHLGEVCTGLGRIPEAYRYLERSRQIRRRIMDEEGEAAVQAVLDRLADRGTPGRRPVVADRPV